MSEEQSQSGKQKVLADLPPAMFAAVVPQFAIHPMNVAVTRVIKYPVKVQNLQQFNCAVFLRQRATGPVTLAEFESLYLALGPSLFNSLLSRTFRFVAQDNLQATAKNTVNAFANENMDDKTKNTLAAGASGALTGASERVLFHPIETIRNQLSMKMPIQHVYSGMSAGLMRDTIGASLFFACYEKSRNPNSKNETRDKLKAATIAGAVTAIVVNPINNIKVEMQCNQSKNLSSLGMFAAAKNLNAAKGVHGFYAGTLGNVAQAPLRSTLPFFAFLLAKKYWEEYRKKKEEREHVVPSIAHAKMC